MLRLTSLLLLLAATPAAAQQPSFDCKAARTPTERAICADADLAALDWRMADLYYGRLKTASDEAPHAARQSVWLRWRDTCGADAACLRRRYNSRIVDLLPAAAGPVGQLPAPVAPTPGTGPCNLAPATGPVTHRLRDMRYETVHSNGVIDWISVQGGSQGTTCPNGAPGSAVFFQQVGSDLPPLPPGANPLLDAVERRLLQAIDGIIPPANHAEYRAAHAALPIEQRVIRHIDALEYFARD